MGFESEVALVTGGANGLGFAYCDALAVAGVGAVLVHDMKQKDVYRACSILQYLYLK